MKPVFAAIAGALVAVGIAYFALGGTETAAFEITTGGCKGNSALACCANSENQLRSTLEGISGVEKVELDRSTRKATVKFRKGALESDSAKQAFAKYGVLR